MAKHRSGKEPSQRQRRVNELLRHAMAEILLRDDITDDALRGVAITVTEVQTSPDLTSATVFVMPLGGVEETEVLAGLERNSRYLRGLLAKRVELKFSPTLAFELDQTFDHADRVDALLRSDTVSRDLG